MSAPVPVFEFPPGRLATRKQHLMTELRRPAPTRRWWIRPAVALALVAAAGVAANVALGLGIGGRIHDFVAGTPAPPAIEERLRDEATAERIIPLLAEEWVEVTGPAHGVLAIETSGGPVALWTAPTKTRGGTGPVCYLVEFVRLSERAGKPLGDGRCIPRTTPTAGISWGRTKQEVDGKVVAVVSGVVGPNVVSALLRSSDGATSEMALEGRFFLAELPQPDAEYDLLALDAEGLATATAQVNWFSAGVQDFHDLRRIGQPRTIIETRDSLDRPLRLMLQAAQNGVLCRWVGSGGVGRGGGGTCGPESGLRAKEGISVGPGMTAGVMTLDGSVGPEIASLELHYQDGRVDRIPIVERFVLFGVRPERFREGKRPVVLVGRDESGKAVAERRLSPDLFDSDSPIWLDESIGP